MSSEDLAVTLQFLQWQDLYEIEKPFQIFINVPKDAEDPRNTNLAFEGVNIPVHDVRGHSNKYTLDDHGFVYRKHVTTVTNFTDRNRVIDNYLPEVDALLRREVDGVDRVFFFDWRLRKNEPEVEGTIINMNDLTTWLRPAVHVHIDQSPAAALKRTHLQLGEDAPYLLRGRVRIINVWRPLVSSVQDWPLALCDGSTVEPADLIEADHVRRNYTGSTMYLMRNPQQRFYYLSGQGKGEVVIFKNFDSERRVRARYAPHASFLHPNAKEGTLVPRESIEVRAFVFTYPKGVEPPKDGNLR